MREGKNWNYSKDRDEAKKDFLIVKASIVFHNFCIRSMGMVKPGGINWKYIQKSFGEVQNAIWLDLASECLKLLKNATHAKNRVQQHMYSSLESGKALRS